MLLPDLIFDWYHYNCILLYVGKYFCAHHYFPIFQVYLVSIASSININTGLTILAFNLSTGAQLTVAGMKNLTQLTPAQISQIQLFKQQALRQQQMQQQQHSSQLKQVRICCRVQMFWVRGGGVTAQCSDVSSLQKINLVMNFCFQKRLVSIDMRLYLCNCYNSIPYIQFSLSHAACQQSHYHGELSGKLGCYSPDFLGGCFFLWNCVLASREINTFFSHAQYKLILPLGKSICWISDTGTFILYKCCQSLCCLWSIEHGSIICCTPIAFDERVTFWLQRAGSLPCACAFAALYSCTFV